MSDLREKIMSRSTDLSEEAHHKECELECCGSHDIDNDGRCTACNMTEDEIDDHNMLFWSIVDDVEGNDDLCVRYQTAIDVLESFLKKHGVEYTA